MLDLSTFVSSFFFITTPAAVKLRALFNTIDLLQQGLCRKLWNAEFLQILQRFNFSQDAQRKDVGGNEVLEIALVPNGLEPLKDLQLRRGMRFGVVDFYRDGNRHRYAERMHVRMHREWCENGVVVVLVCRCCVV